VLARIYGTVLPITICTIIAGAYFTIRGIQAFVYIILGKVNDLLYVTAIEIGVVLSAVV